MDFFSLTHNRMAGGEVGPDGQPAAAAAAAGDDVPQEALGLLRSELLKADNALRTGDTQVRGGCRYQPKLNQTQCNRGWVVYSNPRGGGKGLCARAQRKGPGERRGTGQGRGGEMGAAATMTGWRTELRKGWQHAAGAEVHGAGARARGLRRHEDGDFPQPPPLQLLPPHHHSYSRPCTPPTRTWPSTLPRSGGCTRPSSSSAAACGYRRTHRCGAAGVAGERAGPTLCATHHSRVTMFACVPLRTALPARPPAGPSSHIACTPLGWYLSTPPAVAGYAFTS